jgi:serine/threonine-protein kinase
MSWAPDDTIVFSPNRISPLLGVSAAGGTPQALTELDFRRGEGSHRWPQVLPSGKAVLFTAPTGAGSVDKSQIEVHSFVTGSRKVLVQGGTSARYVPTGHLVYARAGRLMAAPFDLARLEVTGPAIPLLDGLLVDPSTGAAQFSFSEKGDLVYVAGAPSDRRLVWVDRSGVSEPLGAPPRPYAHPRLSPDGSRVAVTLTGETYDIWLYDIPRDTLTRLTYEADNHYPIWTPDGRRVTFQSNRDGFPNLYWMNADGSGPPERLTKSEYTQITECWSPDGGTLLFVELRPATGWDAWLLPLQGERKPRPFVQTSFLDGTPQISPDGRWVAHISDETGRTELYVRPFPGPGGKWQISTEGGSQAAWRRDGQELFYRNGDKMMAVAVSRGEGFSASRPALLFEKRYEQIQGKNYDVSADGRHFLMVQGEPETASRMNVVLNWFEELKRRVPAAGK